MVRISILAVFAGVLCAQNTENLFDKPPAGVDKALRSRITEFYEYHVKGEFRKAEALVADDTKEFFYSHNKPSYLSFEIGKIQYSDGYKRAKATVICEQYVMLPGFADKPMKVPTPSSWKLVKGKWYWYVDKNEIGNSPFGKMVPGAPSGRGGIPAVIPDSVDPFLKQVKADKAAVTLKPGYSEKVTITNTAPGMMNISVFGALPGVEAKLDRGSLSVSEKAVLTITAAEGAKPGLLTVRVEQTGESIPIRVEIQ
jgi:hypothetical protein